MLSTESATNGDEIKGLFRWNRKVRRNQALGAMIHRATHPPGRIAHANMTRRTRAMQERGGFLFGFNGR